MLCGTCSVTNPPSVRQAVTIAFVVCGLLSRTATLFAITESPSRVRSANPTVLALLKEGAERSATFQALMAAIEQTNGIVYVEFGYCAFGHLDGCLLPFMAATQGDRYVRVIVSPERTRLSHDQLLALIGHELQHAREVLERPEVVDLATMERLYRKIGTPIVGGDRGYETSAARAAGTAVLSELARSARAPQHQKDVVIDAKLAHPTEFRPASKTIERSLPVSRP